MMLLLFVPSAYGKSDARTIILEDGSRVKITPQLCEQLSIIHEPDADVAYQPGKDAYGEDVTPADLDDGRSLELPQQINVPVDVPLGNPNDPKNKTPRAWAGMVRFDAKSGIVSYNGQALNPSQSKKVRKICESIKP